MGLLFRALGADSAVPVPAADSVPCLLDADHPSEAAVSPPETPSSLCPSTSSSITAAGEHFSSWCIKKKGETSSFLLLRNKLEGRRNLKTLPVFHPFIFLSLSFSPLHSQTPSTSAISVPPDSCALCTSNQTQMNAAHAGDHVCQTTNTILFLFFPSRTFQDCDVCVCTPAHLSL